MVQLLHVFHSLDKTNGNRVVIQMTYEFVIDRRSYTHNLSSCEIKA